MADSRKLYRVTAAATAAFILYVGYSLLQTMSPADDVRAAYRESRIYIRASDFAPGDVRLFEHYDVPFYVWRRSKEDIALAKSQDKVADWVTPTVILADGSKISPALDKHLTYDQEWFFVLAKNPERFGCVVHHRMGDYGGFFDPCRGSHFDLSGRIRKGAKLLNLIVLQAVVTDDGSDFLLNFAQVAKVLR